MKICSVNGCEKKMHAHGYCSAHATKFKRHGDPLAGRRGAPSGAPLRWIEEKVSYSGNDCIKWPFEISRYGYGTIKYLGKRSPASRIMCILAHGAPPTPKHEAAHSCGNGHLACMNPCHLRWATKAENIRDAVSHGTNVRGERCHWAKLKETDVIAIREMAKSMSNGAIAELFGVRQPAISRIVNRVRWSWVK